jgi:hypothetical protein
MSRLMLFIQVIKEIMQKQECLSHLMFMAGLNYQANLFPVH